MPSPSSTEPRSARTRSTSSSHARRSRTRSRSASSRRRARPSTSRSRTRRSPTSCSARSTRARPTISASRSRTPRSRRRSPRSRSSSSATARQKFDAGLKQQGYTLDALREDIRAQLVSEGIYKDVTQSVKLSDADLQKYYNANKERYSVAESRAVRHILVKTKAEADKLHAQLAAGADFAQLAKQSSEDPGSKDQGGNLTVSRGQTVAPFDKAAFSLKTNELSEPVKTEFGYHLIQPLAAVKAGSVTPFADVKAQIRTQLLEERKSAAVNDWAKGIQEKYEGKVTYAAGFEPPETSTGEETETTAGE